MTRANMPGRGAPLHAVAPPRCSLAESLTEAERAMLAELGVHETPPQLRLVRATDVPPRATPAADLRRVRRRELIAGLVMWAVLVGSVSCAVVACTSLPGLTP